MGNQSARETEKVEPFPEIEEGELIVIVAGGLSLLKARGLGGR